MVRGPYVNTSTNLHHPIYTTQCVALYPQLKICHLHIRIKSYLSYMLGWSIIDYLTHFMCVFIHEHRWIALNVFRIKITISRLHNLSGVHLFSDEILCNYEIGLQPHSCVLPLNLFSHFHIFRFEIQRKRNECDYSCWHYLEFHFRLTWNGCRICVVHDARLYCDAPYTVYRLELM